MKVQSKDVGMILGVFFAFALCLCPSQVQAQVGSGIFFKFNSDFPSDPNPDGGAPWVSAYFINEGSEEVQLSITNLTAGHAGNDFIAGEGNGAAAGGIDFNVLSSFDVSNLVFSVVSGSSYDPSVSLSQAQLGSGGNNGGYGFKADGDGYYDIAIEFGNNFGSGDSITFDITDTSGLTATDFEGTSVNGGGEGDFYAAAHIMGLNNGDSTWVDPSLGPQTVPVPEPTPVAILATSIGLLCSARLWRRVKA